MVATRISTYAQHQNTLRNVLQIMGDLSTLRRQITSGKVADEFAELGGKVEFFTALETKKREAEQHIETNKLVITKLNTMAGSLDGLVDLASDLKSLIVNARSATEAEYPVFIQSAQGYLSNAAGLLNNNVGGKYLFGGSKTDRAPVTEPVPAPITDGVPDAGYYAGDAVSQKVKATDSLEIAYGVRADAQGFQELFAAIHMALDGLNTKDDDKLASSIDMVTSAIEHITAIKADISNNVILLNNANDTYDASITYIKTALAEQDTDVLAATTQVSINEGLLQASFQTFARMSNLKLSDYLR